MVGGVDPHLAAGRPNPSDRRVARAGGGPELADRLWPRRDLSPDRSARGTDHHAVGVPVLGVDVVAELHPSCRTGVSPRLPVGAGAAQRQAQTGPRVDLALDHDIPVADREHPGKSDSRGISPRRQAGHVTGHQGGPGCRARRSSPPRHGADLMRDHGAARSTRIVELDGAGRAKHPALWLPAVLRRRDAGDLVGDGTGGQGGLPAQCHRIGGYLRLQVRRRGQGQRGQHVDRLAAICCDAQDPAERGLLFRIGQLPGGGDLGLHGRLPGGEFGQLVRSRLPGRPRHVGGHASDSG